MESFSESFGRYFVLGKSHSGGVWIVRRSFGIRDERLGREVMSPYFKHFYLLFFISRHRILVFYGVRAHLLPLFQHDPNYQVFYEYINWDIHVM
jgi:hypothetical protein